MLDQIFKFFWDILERIAGYFLDLLVWLLELVYSLINGVWEFLLVTFGDLVVGALEGIKPHVPEGLLDNVFAMYEWLEYIDEWVPVSFAIKLLIAYFAIMVVMTVIRWVMRLVPGMGG